jgi:RNA polymerase-binding transcription factor DksA
VKTTTADRYVSRARFSASDRPIPPDLHLVASIEARRTKRLSPKQLGALERAVRSARGRLERTMARSRSRRIARRRRNEPAAQSDAGSSTATAFSPRVLARHQELLEATRRVEAGTYGVCVRCQAPIEYERLLDDPTTTHCAECAARVTRQNDPSVPIDPSP